MPGMPAGKRMQGRDLNARPPGYEPGELPLLHLAIDSCGVGQLGPDLRPIVRAKVFSGHSPTGCFFDGNATLNRDRTNPISPLADENGGNADVSCEVGARLVCEILIEVHGSKLAWS